MPTPKHQAISTVINKAPGNQHSTTKISASQHAINKELENQQSNNKL